jgi:uncharacterized phiE125 gp8 family phage protein
MDSAVLTTPPAFEPITLAEAQTHLIINGQADYITSLIKTARMMLERELERSFILQTWTGYAGCWDRKIFLDYPPILSVTSVKYYNLDGTLTTLQGAGVNYWVNISDGCIDLAYDFTVPELQYGRPNAIEVVYKAGYVDSATEATVQAAVPEPIKHAMKLLITDMHEHRGQYVIGSIANKLPGYILNLVHPYKMYNLCG